MRGLLPLFGRSSPLFLSILSPIFFKHPLVYHAIDLFTSIGYNGTEKYNFTYTDNNQMSLIKDFADNRRTRLIYDATGNISGVLVTEDAQGDGGNELLSKEYLPPDSANGFVVSVNSNVQLTQSVRVDEYYQAERHQ